MNKARKEALPADVTRDLSHVRQLVLKSRLAEALPILEDVVARSPDVAEGWRQLGRVLAQMGSDAAAFGALRKASRQPGLRAKALTLALQILLERRKLVAAGRLGAVLAQYVGRIAQLDGLLCELAYELGELDVCDVRIAAAEAAHERIPRVERIKRQLASLRAETAARDDAPLPRHIAIGGVSHVGSTAFGVLLGSVPGLAFAGETQALTEIKSRNNNQLGRVLITESDAPQQKWPIACRVCKRTCEVFNPDARLRLAANPTQRYAQIARLLNTEIVVSSDKIPELYLERDPLFRFDFIVLFKSPFDQMRSHLKNFARTGEMTQQEAVEKIAGELDLLLNRWATNYFALTRQIKPTGRHVVLDWTQFVARPAAHFKRLGELLGIPIAEDVNKHIRLGHFIGGNMGVDVQQLRATGRLEIRPSNAPPLPPEIEARIAGNPRAMLISALLKRAYEADFAQLA